MCERPPAPAHHRTSAEPVAERLYIIIIGAGKVGWNLARELLEKGNEVTLIDNDRDRFQTVEQELEHNVQYGDASELWVLERAGVHRADMVIAVTGDDEDNMLICQVAKEKYLCERIIARVNNPRNLEHLEIIELLLPEGSPATGQRVGDLTLPEGTLLISVLRGSEGLIPNADTVLE